MEVIAQAGDILLKAADKYLYDNKIKKGQFSLELALLGNKAGRIGVKNLLVSQILRNR